METKEQSTDRSMKSPTPIDQATLDKLHGQVEGRATQGGYDAFSEFCRTVDPVDGTPNVSNAARIILRACEIIANNPRHVDNVRTIEAR